MHDKANKPIGAVCVNAFAYAALTLFYIANFVTNKNDRNLKFALQFAKMIRFSRETLTPYAKTFAADRGNLLVFQAYSPLIHHRLETTFFQITMFLNIHLQI